MKTSFALPLIGLFLLMACGQNSAIDNEDASSSSLMPVSPFHRTHEGVRLLPRGEGDDPEESAAIQQPQVIAENLSVPWAIAFLPDGDILITERPGTLLRLSDDGQTRTTIDGVAHVGEGGLLGIALHPDFENNNHLYLYLTTRADAGIRNRVERYVLRENTLTDRTVIIDDIPGSTNHDGGALAFGPDGMLYVTTGDATNSDWAQDTAVLAGKILRVRDDGSIPADNPFNNAVWSYGHRNPQGIAWDDAGNLWATEHGRSGLATGYDELNRIEVGKNYGWPTIQGGKTREGMTTPVLHSGARSTWAPASAAYLHGSIFFGGLRGEALYEAVLQRDGSAATVRTHLRGMYGRIRAVAVGPDNILYITTSNMDGRGTIREGDDRLIRIDPRSLEK